jgi:hypothetical protein
MYYIGYPMNPKSEVLLIIVARTEGVHKWVIFGMQSIKK